MIQTTSAAHVSPNILILVPLHLLVANPVGSINQKQSTFKLFWLPIIIPKSLPVYHQGS